jgi:hypothetical protein
LIAAKFHKQIQSVIAEFDWIVRPATYLVDAQLSHLPVTTFIFHQPNHSKQFKTISLVIVRLASKCSCFCCGWKLLKREFLLWLIRQRLPNEDSALCSTVYSHPSDAGVVLHRAAESELKGASNFVAIPICTHSR